MGVQDVQDSSPMNGNSPKTSSMGKGKESFYSVQKTNTIVDSDGE